MIGLLTMEEKRYDVAAVKERLNEYREKERDIDNQIERLVRLVTKMSSVGAQTITECPDPRGRMVTELESSLQKRKNWRRIFAVMSGTRKRSGVR